MKKGLEEKAQVYLGWWGDFEWGYPNRHALNSMTAVLNIKLRERIREELGGTYSIGAYGSSSRIPKPTYSISVGFGCKPGEVDTLIAAVNEEIAALQKAPVEQSYVDTASGSASCRSANATPRIRRSSSSNPASPRA